jgi:hypothetical protein
MSDEAKKQAWSRIGLAAAVLFAYVVSIGPAFRSWGEATLRHPAYAPLLVASRCPPIGHALVWYLNKWSNSDGFAIYGNYVDSPGGAVLFFKLNISCGFGQSSETVPSD